MIFAVRKVIMNSYWLKVNNTVNLPFFFKGQLSNHII